MGYTIHIDEYRVEAVYFFENGTVINKTIMINSTDIENALKSAKGLLTKSAPEGVYSLQILKVEYIRTVISD